MSTTKDRGRRRILEAAAHVFQSDGFQTATMARVAEAAGVSKGLPYHYFESKEAIAAAVVAGHLDSVLRMLAHWPGGEPADRLEWFLETALEHARHNQESYRLFLSLGLQPATRTLVLDEIERRRAELDAVDEELRSIFGALGRRSPEADAMLVRATVDGLIQYLLMAPGRFPDAEAAMRVVAAYGSREEEEWPGSS